MTQQSIGNQLKKARQKKGLTLEDIYKHTRIRPDILASLEEDNSAKMLNTTYVRSFLKEYSDYLGLNTAGLLSQYDTAYPRESVRSYQQPGKPQQGNYKRLDTESLLKAVKIALIIVLAAILIIYFFRAVLWVKKGIQQYSSQRAKQVELKKAAEPKKSRDKKAASKSAARTAAVQKTLPAAKVISIPQGEKLKLSIAASEDVWTELKVDGKVIFSGVIKKGSLETWEADNQFTLWTGNASVIKLGLNGNDLGSPGRGVIKDIVINRQGIKNGR